MDSRRSSCDHPVEALALFLNSPELRAQALRAGASCVAVGSAAVDVLTTLAYERGLSHQYPYLHLALRGVKNALEHAHAWCANASDVQEQENDAAPKKSSAAQTSATSGSARSRAKQKSPRTRNTAPRATSKRAQSRTTKRTRTA